jgi:hypothetical protein
MYKELFRQVMFLISRPEQAWKELAEKEERGDEFLTKFVYPLIGFVAASAFIGVLFTEREFDIEHAIKSAIKAIFSFFGGFFMAAYLLNEAWKSFFKQANNLQLCRRFIGYASVAMFVIHIIFALLPLLPLMNFFFLRVFILFIATIYIVWEGAIPYMKVEDKIRLKFVMTVSLLIVMLPEIINRILFMLLPGLRF